MAQFEYNGRILPLKFTLGAWERMEQEVCDLDGFFKMYAHGEDNKALLMVDTMHKTLELAVILSDEAGAVPKVTFDGLRLALYDKPALTIKLRDAVSLAVAEGLIIENKEKPGPRDLVLEEIEPKKD